MKRGLGAVVAAGLLCIGTFAQQASEPQADLTFDKGIISNGIYTNHCLGFTFAIPEGWQIFEIPNLTQGKALHLPGGRLGLLTIDRKTEKPFGDRIALTAIDGTKTAVTPEAYVSAAARKQVEADPEKLQIIHNAYPVEYHGKVFFRADFKRLFRNGQTQFDAFVYTKFREFLIGETLVASSPEALDEAADSLKQISFQDGQENPKCVLGEDKGPTFGVIGSVMGSLPKSATGSPSGVRISSIVAQGLLDQKVAPKYPDAAREAKIEGTVLLQIVIDTNGNVENATLISGHPMLAPSAIEAAKQWKYKPYLLNGTPTKAIAQVSILFSLAGPTQP